MIRIIVIDEHALVREREEPDLRVVGSLLALMKFALCRSVTGV